MFSTFDLCLLLYVIRLAGWLKHCNLRVWGMSGSGLATVMTVTLSQMPNVGKFVAMIGFIYAGTACVARTACPDTRHGVQQCIKASTSSAFQVVTARQVV